MIRKSWRRSPAVFFFGAALVLLILLAASLDASRNVALAGARYGWEGSLRHVAEIVQRDDELAPSDYILILNGRVDVRAARAAELYHQGVAPVILIAEAAEPARFLGAPEVRRLHQVFAEHLAAAGVPRGAIRYLPYPQGVVNTRDEARALRSFLLEHPAKRIVVVTSDYHTSRAYLVVRQELNGLPVDVRTAGVEVPGMTSGDWWRSPDGVRTYRLEYLKWACALVRCR